MTTAAIYFIPAAASAVFTQEELDSFGGERIHKEYLDRCVALTIAKGYKLQSVKGSDYYGFPVFTAQDVEKAHGLENVYGNEELMAISDGMVARFIRGNNVHMYAREKEEFSIAWGVKEAMDAGKRSVMVEDLS
jgi:hypothetical protein